MNYLFTLWKLTYNHNVISKTLRIMKITAFILLVTCMQLSATGYSQNVTLSLKNVKPQKVFTEINHQTGYQFFYNDALLDKAGTVSIEVENTPIEKVLNQCFKNMSVTFSIFEKTIVLKKEVKPEANNAIEVPPPIIVTGSVIDAKTSETLVGVSIRIEGTSNGVITDLNGKFTLNIPKPDLVLIFSCIGYDTQRVILKGQLVLDIRLMPSLAKLDEVVIVGYGNQKKQSVVSAISTVKGDELRMPTRNLTNNLAGQVAGLISIQRSAVPGYDDSEFWIRGISTFAGGSTPLVLVDGVPRKISDIEPDEIETFSILKDAAATAVYGAEGANGVVIVTSKRGLVRKPVITFRAEHSISKPNRLPQFVGSAEYLTLYNEALRNDGQSPIFSDDLINKYKSNVDPDLYPNTDWVKIMLKDVTQNDRYTLNVRGGTEQAKYFVSGAYYGENGYFKDDPTNRYNNNIGLKRFNLRSNIDLQVSKTAKVSVDLSGQYLITNYPGTATETIFRQMLITPPYVFPPFYSDGTLSTYLKERDVNMRNPYNMLMNSGYSREWRSGIQSSVRFDQKLNFITQGLSFKAMVSYDYNGLFSSTRSYNPSRYFATGRDVNGNLIFSRSFAGSSDLSAPSAASNAQKYVYFENSLNYNRTFGKHEVGGMILYMQKEQQNSDNALAFRKQGVVGRLTYAFDNRYFIEGNFGYTGSETFAPGYRFGFFPAVGIGYLISNEHFYPEQLKEIVSTLKFRTSFGRTGNDNTGGARFLYRPTFGFAADGFNQGITSGGGVNGYGAGIVEGQFEAPYLSWEIENKKNFGINIGLLNDKIQFAGDYYNDERSGILLQRRTIPAPVGFRSAPWLNYGKVKSWGFDGSLDGQYTFDNKLTIGMRGTFTFARNKITEYDELPKPYPWMAVTGTRVSENTLYIAERLYTENDFIVTQNTNGTNSYTLKSGIPLASGVVGPGDIKYVDLNNDGKIDQFDMKRGVGNPYNPEVIYGFGLNLQYKGFYASVFFQGAGKTSVLLGGNTNEGWLPFQWSYDQSNFRTFALDRWTEADPKQNPLMPRLHMNGNYGANNMAPSTWWLRDGSFLRLKNMEVGYNLPALFLERFKIKTARIYLMGYNLALWDKIKFWDPETGNSSAGNSYPNSSTYTIGLEMSLF